MKKLRVESCVPGPPESMTLLGLSATAGAAPSTRSRLSGCPPVASSANRDSSSAVKGRGGVSHIGTQGNSKSRAKNFTEPQSSVSSKPSRVPADPPCSAQSRNASFVVRRNVEDAKPGGPRVAHFRQLTSHSGHTLGEFPTEESADLSEPILKKFAERGAVHLRASDGPTQFVRGVAKMEACRPVGREARSSRKGSAATERQSFNQVAPSINVHPNQSIQEGMSSMAMASLATAASPGSGRGTLCQEEEVHFTPEQKGQGWGAAKELTQGLLSPPGTEPSFNKFCQHFRDQRLADSAACDDLDAGNLPVPANQVVVRFGGMEGLENLEANASWQQGASNGSRCQHSCRGSVHVSSPAASSLLKGLMAPASPSLLTATPIREQQPFPLPGIHPGIVQPENLATRPVANSQPDGPLRTSQKCHMEGNPSAVAETVDTTQGGEAGRGTSLDVDCMRGPPAASAAVPPAAPAMSCQDPIPHEKLEMLALPSQLPQRSKSAAPPPPPPPPSKSKTARPLPPPPPRPPGAKVQGGPPPPPPPPGKGRASPAPPPRKASGGVEPAAAPAPSKPMVKLFWEKLPPYQVHEMRNDRDDPFFDFEVVI